MTGCKGEDCPFYVEFWSDVDKIDAGCSHPEFDEMKHSIKFGRCPFMDEVAIQAQQGQVKERARSDGGCYMGEPENEDRTMRTCDTCRWDKLFQGTRHNGGLCGHPDGPFVCIDSDYKSWEKDTHEVKE